MHILFDYPDTSRRMLKIWNTGAFVALEPIGYVSLVDMIHGGVPMSTTDVLTITHAMVKRVSYLHTVGLVHGDLKEKHIYINHQKPGKVRRENIL